MNVKKTLAANTDLEAAENKKLKGDKENLISVLSEQDRESVPVEKRIKGANICSGLDLRYVGVASKVLKHLSACCGFDSAELCPLDAVPKPRWIPTGESVPHNEVVVSPSSLIAPPPSDFIARWERSINFRFL